MDDLTLESLAKRVAALEAKLAARPAEPAKDWRHAAGTFEDGDYEPIIVEGAAIRQAEREAARRDVPAQQEGAA